MTNPKQLSEKIRNRLERHQSVRAKEQKQLDRTMTELIEEREKFTDIAHRITELVIVPLMEELPCHFDHATIRKSHDDTGFRTVCELAHIPRFPATVTFTIEVVPGKRPTELTIRSDIEILPMLMEFPRSEENVFSINDPNENVGSWVEEKILGFVDTYLRLETHPLYQKDNLVTDPICGMRLSVVAATNKLERHGQFIYFCSQVCKEAFLKKNSQP